MEKKEYPIGVLLRNKNFTIFFYQQLSAIFGLVKSINIGLDAKRAFSNHTGLGNYSRNLLRTLALNTSELQLHLFSPKVGGDLMQPLLDEIPDKFHLHSNRSQYPNSFWRSFFIKKELSKHSIQIYHGLSAELPMGKRIPNLKYIVTIHDLIFLRYPHLYPTIDRKIYLNKTKAACKKADTIIATSEQTKQDLIQLLQIPSSRIKVIYQNCATAFQSVYTKATLDKIRAKYKLPKQFILNVGTIEQRKNALLLLQALTFDKNLKAVFVGKKTNYQTILDQFIAKNNLNAQVTFLSDIPFADLPAIYQAAHLFAYPSRFEGFGIPIIEAMHSGLPVIASAGSCLEETAGKHSLFVAPEDAEGLYTNISNLYNNKELYQQMVQNNTKHLEQFSATNFAKKTVEAYKELLH